jgi:hypothetical protein
LNEEPVSDKAKGELHIAGQRRVAIDIQSLCEHLDLIVGANVAEVIMNQNQLRQGKNDAARIRQGRSEATIQQIVELIVDAESLSGVGVVKVIAPEISHDSVDLEISNPCVKRTSGAAKSFLFSYWCGVFTELVGKEFKIGEVTYDENKNSMKCRIILR